MNAKRIEYGSTKHDELEKYFSTGWRSLWDVYKTPSDNKVNAYNRCLYDCYITGKKLSETFPEGVRTYYRIRSHNVHVFTMIAKHETAHGVFYEVWFPTRKEFYVVPNP